MRTKACAINVNILPCLTIRACNGALVGYARRGCNNRQRHRWQNALRGCYYRVHVQFTFTDATLVRTIAENAKLSVQHIRWWTARAERCILARQNIVSFVCKMGRIGGAVLLQYSFGACTVSLAASKAPAISAKKGDAQIGAEMRWCAKIMLLSAP